MQPFKDYLNSSLQKAAVLFLVNPIHGNITTSWTVG
jgi:hypothetical protein